ncbi:MAG: hypothetical protein AAF995_07985 [Planctomycetota bacterium]
MQAYFSACESDLLAAENQMQIRFGAQFAVTIPRSGGAYLFHFQDRVLYAGETTSLRQRLAVHMRNPENHVLILKIARQLYDWEHGHGASGNRRRFDEAHKERSRQWVEQHLSVSFRQMRIGRKELEEFLVERHQPEFNKRYPTLPSV